MKSVMMRGCAAVALASCLASPAFGAEKTPKSVMPEAVRAAPAERGVSVTVPQAELGSNINALGVAGVGGVLPVLIEAKVDADRAKRAEAGITPIRAALIDFDADQLALDATKAGTDAVPWLGAKPADYTRDPTTVAKSARLDAGSEGQVAFFDYVYDTSPDFSSIRVGVRIVVADKVLAKGKPEARLAPKNVVYDHTVTSVVQLAMPGTPDANSQRWAAHDGDLAKRALAVGFADIGSLIPVALNFTADDLKRVEAGEVRTVGAYTGKVQEDGPKGTLLFNGGLMHVQTLQE